MQQQKQSRSCIHLQTLNKEFSFLNMQKQLIALSLVVLATTMFPGGVYASSLIFRLESHQEQCFMNDVNKENVRVFVHYVVTEGGSFDVDLRITDPDNKVIYTTYKTNDRRVLFNAEKSGTYRLCFSNEVSSAATKFILFTTHVDDPLATGHKPTSDAEATLIRVGEALSEIREDQTFMGLREADHRHTTESTNTRILWYGIFEIVVLVGMSAGQVWFLQRALSKPRRFV